MSTTKNVLKSIGEEIANVDRRQRTMRESMAVFGKMGKDVSALRTQYYALGRAADTLRASQSRLADVQSRIDANSARRSVIGGELRGAATTFGVVAASAMLPVRSAVAFENAMLGVAKQVEGARDASGNLTPIYSAIRKEIFGMAREVPVVTTELAGMAAAGARMGVARTELMGFVRTSAMMADAFEMPSAQLADDMGKIAGLFHIPIPRIGELADAINYLDDNTRSTGGGIIDVMRRIGGMAATIKMPAREAAALGSTFLSLGSSAEVAGTASNAVMRILGAATVQSKRVREGLSSIGFNPADVQSSMSKDSTGTILRLLDKLNTLSSEQRMVAATSIFGAEYGDDIAKLSTGTAEYRKQLELVRSEQANGSMSREFNARLKTTGAQWQIAKNRAFELGTVIGQTLLPSVNSLMGAVGPMVTQFAEFAQRNPGMVKSVIATTLALTGARVAILGVGYAVTAIKGPVLSVMGYVARWRAAGALASMGRFGPVAMRAVGAIRVVGGAIAAIGGGPIAIAVAAITAGALVVRKYWQPIKAFMGGVWDGFRTEVQPAIASVMSAVQPLRPAWESISGAIGDAWGSVVKFLEPVIMSKSELSAIAVVGKLVGSTLANSFTVGIKVIAGVIRHTVWLGTKIVEVGSVIVSAFTSAWGKVESVVGASTARIMRLISPMVGAVGTVAGMLGFSMPATPASDATGKQPAAMRPPVKATGKRPPAFAVAPSARAGTSPPAQQSYVFHVTQLPGESGEEFARRVAAMTKRQDSVTRRGSLVDGARGAA